jgi:hypothetical protein
VANVPYISLPIKPKNDSITKKKPKSKTLTPLIL